MIFWLKFDKIREKTGNLFVSGVCVLLGCYINRTINHIPTRVFPLSIVQILHHTRAHRTSTKKNFFLSFFLVNYTHWENAMFRRKKHRQKKQQQSDLQTESNAMSTRFSRWNRWRWFERKKKMKIFNDNNKKFEKKKKNRKENNDNDVEIMNTKHTIGSYLWYTNIARAIHTHRSFD